MKILIDGWVNPDNVWDMAMSPIQVNGRPALCSRCDREAVYRRSIIDGRTGIMVIRHCCERHKTECGM